MFITFILHDPAATVSVVTDGVIKLVSESVFDIKTRTCEPTCIYELLNTKVFVALLAVAAWRVISPARAFKVTAVTLLVACVTAPPVLSSIKLQLVRGSGFIDTVLSAPGDAALII